MKIKNIDILVPKVNVNLKILPFGHINIEIKGSETERKAKTEQPVRYGEPGTSYPPIVEIIFGGEEYKVLGTNSGICLSV